MRDVPIGTPTRPDLVAALAAGWAIDAAVVDFMPVGLDVDAAAFAVTGTDGGRWFLKLRRHPPLAASVAVPHHLQRLGLAAAVAPLPTRGAAPWLPVADFFALLYPFIDAPSTWTSGLTDRQWCELGQFVGAMHRADVPAEVAADVRVDDFRCAALPKLDELAGRLATAPDGPVTALWRHHHELIAAMISRAEVLARALRVARLPKVLCHADLHGGNILARPGGPVWVVDWDEPTLAPRERDLIFISLFPFGANGPTNRFAAGYGDLAPDPRALAYFGYERVLDDVYEFTRHLLDPATGPTDAAESLHWLERQFAPGGAAELVRRIDPAV